MSSRPQAAADQTTTLDEAFRAWAILAAGALAVPIGACAEADIKGLRWSLHIVAADDSEDGCDDDPADPPPKSAGNGGRGRPPSGCREHIRTALRGGASLTVKQLAGAIRRAGGPDFPPSTLRDNLHDMERGNELRRNEDGDEYRLA